MVTQNEIARRLGMDVSSVNKILNRRKDAKFRPETVNRVMKTAARLGFNFGRLKYPHQRRHPRREVSTTAEVEIYLPDESLFDRGTVKILDISLGGALLSDLRLEKKGLPVGPFRIALRPRAGEGLGPELRGRLVRIQHGDPYGFGMAFDAPQESGFSAAGALPSL